MWTDTHVLSQYINLIANRDNGNTFHKCCVLRKAHKNHQTPTLFDSYKITSSFHIKKNIDLISSPHLNPKDVNNLVFLPLYRPHGAKSLTHHQQQGFY